MQIGWKLFILTAAVLVVFTILYMAIERWTLVDAFFNSVMLTTTVGPTISPKWRVTKLLMSAQALTTFALIAQGFIQIL
jgi:hypothetical protein